VKDHYSYTVYADPAVAASFDQARFGGPIGALLLEDQERALTDFLGPLSGSTVLDVGTGTGRASLMLARGGARVVGLDASREMLGIARQRAAAAGLEITYLEGDAHSLSFEDRSFDKAVCLRVLMHTPDWRRCLSELCRVTREIVVFDYPALISAAALQALSRRVRAWLGYRTVAYRVLSDTTIARELARHGFRVVGRRRQFVMPIAVHKLIGSAAFTRTAEAALAAIGLHWMAASPVTLAAERCES
jgi:ubiquinone/menaquinone biosynthesis C-methylase UbiE